MIVLGLAMIATAATPAPGPVMPGWLAGCWTEQKGPNWTEECWTGPRAGNMMGSGRNGRGEEVRSWETMQVERKSDGSLVFYGSVKGSQRVAFTASGSGLREIVFTNPQHDYPQRIRYWREGMDLNAEISLMDGSKAHSWHYKRQGGN
jgi:hypothetical protein